jgi:hypothetical protein
MTSLRLPLSVREGTSDQPALREGVPGFVEEELRGWIFRTASQAPDQAKHALIRLGLTLPAEYRRRYAQELDETRAEQARLDAEHEAAMLAWQTRQGTQGTQRTAAGASPLVLAPVMVPARRIASSPADPYARFLAVGTEAAILWDVADDLLHALCAEPLPPGTSVLALGKRADAKRTSQITGPLARLLAESRSVYEIRPDQRGLQRRAGAVLAGAADRAVSLAAAAGRPGAGEYLTKARDRLFCLHPDPGAAYVDMIRAVEAVACPLFLPADPLPTLGKLRAHLLDAAPAYEYVLPGKDRAGNIDGVIAMITDLWEGHSDRHAGGPSSVQVSQEAAEAAFTLTVSLVTLFSSGAVTRRAGSRPAP